MHPAPPSSHRLRVSEKAGYSLGELGGSGLWQAMMIFLPVFYTDVFGLPAAATGTMFLVVRIIDAATDPVMGMIADRTQTRWGKFRPYLLWAAVPFGVGALALFGAPALPEAARLPYAYATYIAMMLVYTVAMIPFSALSGVMTPDAQERTSLNSFRFVGAFAAALLVQGLVQPGVRWFGQGDAAVGYRWTIGLFALVSVLTFGIAFRSTRERVRAAVAGPRASVRQDLTDLLHNRPWLIILGVTLVSLVHISIRSAAQVYYFKYGVGDEALVSPFMVAGTAAILVGIAFMGPMSRRWGKKTLYMTCLAVSGVASLGFAWVDPGAVGMLFALQILSSFAAGPTMPLLWSMMADAADYSEWRTGRRATGLVFSASTFATKFGGALGGAVAMYVLARTGYEPNAVQSIEVIGGLQQMMGIYPAVGAALSFLLLAGYGLDSARMDAVSRELALRAGPAGSVAG